jgi:transcriptional regulator with XRE-family HTH domain
MTALLNAETLRQLREARRWDQQTLAQSAGVDPSVISRLERGIQEDLRASVLVSLARALHTSVDSLLAEPLTPGPLTADLSAAVQHLATLSPMQQRQVAALIRAYVETVP